MSLQNTRLPSSIKSSPGFESQFSHLLSPDARNNAPLWSDSHPSTPEHSPKVIQMYQMYLILNRNQILLMYTTFFSHGTIRYLQSNKNLKNSYILIVKIQTLLLELKR